MKADELDRMREFSENILESLNDGLVVVDRDDRIVRWNRRARGALRRAAHEEAVGRRSPTCSSPRSSTCACGARRESAEGGRSTACR
jgi:PAS domain-containing protein